jgi:putative transposase
MIDKNMNNITLSRQAELLWVSRWTIYYKPIVNQLDKIIMDAIDKIYMEFPCYGREKMKLALYDEYDLVVWYKKIKTLKNIMWLETIYPKPKWLSDPNKQDKKFPYLLKYLMIIRPNQVWATDITYIPTKHWWVYLVVMMDWYSRYVISWELSNTLETEFCSNALNAALQINTPEIHNSDQWSQFTSNDYVWILQENEIQISMDGRWRYLDNIFVERLWRSVKYEEVYINTYDTITDAHTWIWRYITKYNTKRYHESLGYKTPEEVYIIMVPQIWTRKSFI